MIKQANQPEEVKAITSKCPDCDADLCSIRYEKAKYWLPWLRT